ncbi:NnrS family protein [Marinovum sp.]|uniref:NnrS family protein n=1 Tax=Marinovum sp. TaxID=2024839 RepID=UPI003A92B8F5
MTQTSAQQMRAWQGAALFSFGFRPFFLFGTLWAGFAMGLWIAVITGGHVLPTRFDPVAWHAHEFLFGYLGAVLAGFLLTAMPNWTGRLPLVGRPLMALFGLWALGRIAVLFSAHLPQGVAVTLDLAFPVVLGAVILREIMAGKNWRNLLVLGLLALFTLANALFHLEAARGGAPAQGLGLRLGLATAVMMIAVIGGRIIPSFTRNWLAREGHPARPAPPMQKFDKLVLLASLAGLLCWALWPASPLSGLALLGLGLLHLTRLARWQGHRTLREPLVWVLHAGYAMVPVGALALGAAILTGGAWAAAAQHIWMAGAIGGMTLAVMTRATLGHTGQPLTAGPATVVLYLALFGSVAARLGAGITPWLTSLSALLWLAAFLGYALTYGPLLAFARKEH